MKIQDLFSSKDRRQKLKCRLRDFCLAALRVKDHFTISGPHFPAKFSHAFPFSTFSKYASAYWRP